MADDRVIHVDTYEARTGVHVERDVQYPTVQIADEVIRATLRKGHVARLYIDLTLTRVYRAVADDGRDRILVSHV
jgi:hypothetical protein